MKEFIKCEDCRFRKILSEKRIALLAVQVKKVRCEMGQAFEAAKNGGCREGIKKEELKPSSEV